jgi:hypothetical protein
MPITPKSLSELLQIVGNNHGRFVWRGIKKIKSQPLVPSIGRKHTDIRKLLRLEKAIFHDFKEFALPHLDIVPRDDWEWLALGQHHGLPTRLMDWSSNPLVGAYFACAGDSAGEDSVIYIHPGGKKLDSTVFKPFAVKSAQFVALPHVTLRLPAQQGLFSIHPDPRKPFTSPDLGAIIIKRKLRSEILRGLFNLGVAEMRLFPGLDGLCRSLRYQYGIK